MFIIEVEHLTPRNIHPLPIAEAWDGAHWTVDISYRTHDVDVDTTAQNADLYTARRHAYSNLKRLLTKD